MPMVITRSGKVKHFPYTTAGIKAAKAYAIKNRSRVQSTRLNGERTSATFKSNK